MSTRTIIFWSKMSDLHGDRCSQNTYVTFTPHPRLMTVFLRDTVTIQFPVKHVPSGLNNLLKFIHHDIVEFV